MFDFLKSFDSIIAIVQTILVFIVGMLTAIITKNSNKYDSARVRLDNAYHPLFMEIEPYLFKTPPKEFVLKFIVFFNEINTKQSLYFYPTIRLRIALLEKEVISDQDYSQTWLIICNRINSDYDKLCKTCHMPLRSTSYRLNKNQYETKFKMYLGMVKTQILQIILFFTLLFLFYISTK
ncbi:MAG: hypothetical protein HY818_03655 [Acetobacterium woodii]|nr:hypothetical protein [Acetobacterium woodii]